MHKRLFEKKKEKSGVVDPRNMLNELTGKEWIQETVSVWYQRGLGKGHPHTFYERQHPAPFAYLMIQRLLRFFTKKGDLVLDPFCGVGSTLKACALNGRRGVGIELIEKWVELTKKRLATEANKGPEQKIIQGDSREVMRQFEDEAFAMGNPREEVTYFDRDRSWELEVEEFVDCIRNDKKVVVGSSEDALKAMELVHKIYNADPKWRRIQR